MARRLHLAQELAVLADPDDLAAAGDLDAAVVEALPRHLLHVGRRRELHGLVMLLREANAAPLVRDSLGEMAETVKYCVFVRQTF